MDKCCDNCAFFEQKLILVSYDLKDKPFSKTVAETKCLLHKVNVTWPDFQFCGDEHFRPITIKRRLDNLEKLDINE